MNALTSEALSALLEDLGREEPFYRCLFQLDHRSTSVYLTVLHLARSVIATRLWQRAAYLTQTTPDALDVEALRQCMTTEALIPPFGAAPPSDSSPWHAFYLTPSDFAETTRTLDILLKYLLNDSQTAAQRRRF